MVVAVVPVGMMQVAVDQVIDVIAMRNGLVPAIDTMLVIGVVSVAVVPVGTVGWVGGSYFQGVLVDTAVVGRVQMPIVQEVDVVVMLYCGMAAVFAVLVRVVRVYYVLGRHDEFLWESSGKVRCVNRTARGCSGRARKR